MPFFPGKHRPHPLSQSTSPHTVTKKDNTRMIPLLSSPKSRCVLSLSGQRNRFLAFFSLPPFSFFLSFFKFREWLAVLEACSADCMSNLFNSPRDTWANYSGKFRFLKKISMLRGLVCQVLCGTLYLMEIKEHLTYLLGLRLKSLNFLSVSGDVRLMLSHVFHNSV